MNELRISTYVEPRWGSRAAGVATIHKDNQARYYVNNVCVADTRAVGLFTIVTCVDATTHNVLTAFFRLVDREAIPTEASSKVG
jgi:hypothetical protein